MVIGFLVRIYLLGIGKYMRIGHDSLFSLFSYTLGAKSNNRHAGK